MKSGNVFVNSASFGEFQELDESGDSSDIVVEKGVAPSDKVNNGSLQSVYGRKNFYDILSGAFTGGMTRLFTAPLDVIKIRFQVQRRNVPNGVQTTYMPTYYYNSIFHCIRTILKEEGVLAFWHGNLLAELLYITYISSQFGFYHLIRDTTLNLFPQVVEKSQSQVASSGHFFHRDCSNIMMMISFLSGSISAFLSTTISYPLDLLRTRYAVQSYPPVYTSILDAFREAYRREGYRGLYHGWSLTAMSLVPSMGIQFSVYDQVKRMWFREKQEDLLGHVVSGSIAGIVAKVSVLPLDVLKKRAQTWGFRQDSTASMVENMDGCSKPSVRKIAMNIYKYEGISAFYKGMVPSVLKAGLGAALTFAVYEETKKVLSKFE